MINILMLIKTDVYIHQHTVIREGKCHLNSVFHSWIANSCDGDTALCQNSCDGDTALCQNSCDGDTALCQNM